MTTKYKKKDFVKDLACGNRAEGLLLATLGAAGLKAEVNNDSKKNKDYDIAAYLGEVRRTFEVKYDMYAARSGNIAIEFFNPKSNKPTGIDATLADFWVHILTAPLSLWICSVTALKVFLKDNKPFKLISCGGDDNASLYLYKKDFILEKAFTRLDEMSPESVKSLVFS